MLSASTKMVHALRYQGVGAFEYLVNSHTSEWVFLAINPLIYVKHTATEELTNLDIVRIQLLLSSATLAPLDITPASIGSPQGCAICASLSKTSVSPPAPSLPSSIVWAAERGLLAKIVVARVRDLEEATQRAVPALRETTIGNDNEEGGEGGRCDTMCLERELGDALRIRTKILKPKSRQGGLDVEKVPSASGSGSRAARYSTSSSAPGSKATSVAKKHASIAYNAFPTNISDTLQIIFSSSPLVLSVERGQVSAVVVAGASDLVDLKNSTHVAAALKGKIVGLHPAVWTSGVVAKGDMIAVLGVMEMVGVVFGPRGEGR
ncbi:hypothetical protein FIBSPDRAFT_960450 [Athelia psychrophila]|uniref:Carbamoyl phosphate synthase ATP-binding domain-containing protein n=1 Tax=Athelia psychrophila TaxID=1759441 RepID=A0A166CCW8_9AGAM|nr:hypothetical protein FIBSPDRAFT_960450 [Fibularhizoctonia sp. CBS 109695]